jgi:hypothetical protein
MRNTTAILVLAAMTVGGTAAFGQTIAWYRFENGVPGQQIQPNPPPEPANNPVLDSSGNGNNMRTFNDVTGGIYSSVRPWSTVPQFGLPNDVSMGNYRNPQIRDVYSGGAVGGGGSGTTLNDHDFDQFTVEISVRWFNSAGFQTFMGKDPGPGTPGGPLGAVYFMKNGAFGAGTDKIAFKYWDRGGAFREVTSSIVVDPNVFGSPWYNLAVVGNGSGVTFYHQDNATGTYNVVGFELFSGLQFVDSGWTLGRGWFNGPNDWADVELDEVRISSNALTPSQFLGVPQNDSWADVSGSYLTPANWVGGKVPNSFNAVANFGPTSAPQAVTAPASGVFAGQITIGSANGYTLAGPGAYNLERRDGRPEITVLNGTHAITSQVRMLMSSDITVATGAELSVSSIVSPNSLTGLNVLGGGVLRSESYVGGAFTVSGGALYDIGRGGMLIRGSLEGDIRSLVAAWYNSGAQDGPGLGSDFAGGSGRDAYATVAVRLNDAGNLGFPQFSTFQGSFTFPGDVLVRYTYIGDVNLDGLLDATDYNAVLNGLTNGLTGWHNGDTNYDGVVDSVDWSRFVDAYTNQGAPFSAGAPTPGAIPEPAALGLLAPAALLLRRRR